MLNDNKFKNKEDSAYNVESNNIKTFKRKNRGTRMKVLNEEEAKKDDEFYNQYFEENSKDDEFDFKHEEIEEDSFDSDFFKQEEESNEDVDSFDSERQRIRIQKRNEFQKQIERKKPKPKNKNKSKNRIIHTKKLEKDESIKNDSEDKEITVINVEKSESESVKKENFIKRKRELRDRKQVNYNLNLDQTTYEKKSTALLEVNLKENILIFNKRLLYKEENPNPNQKRKKTKMEKYDLFMKEQIKSKGKKEGKTKEEKENKKVKFDLNEKEHTKNELINQNLNIQSIIPANIIHKAQVKDEKWEKLQLLDSQMVNQINFQNKTQKDLLLESIITEIFNNQSLENLQKLDEINKKEISGVIIKKKFNEFVKIKHERNGNVNLTFSKKELVEKIFKNFQNTQTYKQKNHKCAVTGEKAKYFDPLTKQYYLNKEAFKILRERYYVKEEENLLFKIQTLSDLASQKKEKLKKMILSGTTAKRNMVEIISKIGIMKSDPIEIERKQIFNRMNNRNRENCVESRMLLDFNPNKITVSRKIFRDKHSGFIKE